MAAPQSSNLLDVLRKESRFEDDPFKGKWQALHTVRNGTCLKFNTTGDFLAVGCSGGQVLVWELAVTRNLARTLHIPNTNGLARARPADNVKANDVRCVGWSENSRLVFAGTDGGCVAVFDLDSGHPVRLFDCTIVPRFIKPHPTLPSLLLIVPETGMPIVVDWTSGVQVQLSEAILPPPKSGHVRPRFRILKGQCTRCDACWCLPGGRDILVFSSRGDLMRVRLGITEQALCRLNAGRFARVPGTEVSVESSASLDPHSCVRLCYTHMHTYSSASPELQHSVHGPYVLATTRDRGLMLYSADDLQPVDRPYAEPVDGAVLWSGRLAGGDKYILGVPDARAGRYKGGLLAFVRGALGVIKFRRGPPGDTLLLDNHPRMGLLVCVNTRGQVYTLQQPFASLWPGPMYPPGFSLLLVNKEHAEREDEFDLVVEGSGKGGRSEREGEGGDGNTLFTFRRQDVPDTEDAIDVMGTMTRIGSFSEAEQYAGGSGCGGSEVGAQSGVQDDPLGSFARFTSLAALLESIENVSGSGTEGTRMAIDISRVGAFSIAVARAAGANAGRDSAGFAAGADAAALHPLGADDEMSGPVQSVPGAMGEGEEGGGAGAGANASGALPTDPTLSNPYALGIDSSVPVIIDGLHLPVVTFLELPLPHPGHVHGRPRVAMKRKHADDGPHLYSKEGDGCGDAAVDAATQPLPLPHPLALLVQDWYATCGHEVTEANIGTGTSAGDESVHGEGVGEGLKARSLKGAVLSRRLKHGQGQAAHDGGMMGPGAPLSPTAPSACASSTSHTAPTLVRASSLPPVPAHLLSLAPLGGLGTLIQPPHTDSGATLAFKGQLDGLAGAVRARHTLIQDHDSESGHTCAVVLTGGTPVHTSHTRRLLVLSMLGQQSKSLADRADKLEKIANRRLRSLEQDKAAEEAIRAKAEHAEKLRAKKARVKRVSVAGDPLHLGGEPQVLGLMPQGAHEDLLVEDHRTSSMPEREGEEEGFAATTREAE